MHAELAESDFIQSQTEDFLITKEREKEQCVMVFDNMYMMLYPFLLIIVSAGKRVSIQKVALRFHVLFCLF